MDFTFRKEFGKSDGKRWKVKYSRTNIKVNPTNVSAARLAAACPRRVFTTE